MVSEQTGMNISVGYIRLKWPLDLQMDDFLAIHENDTIADMRQLTVDVQLKPLFDNRIVVNSFEIQQARVNTNGFLSDLQVKGHLENLSAWSKGIDLRQHSIELNDA
jgi:hypothetical protein